VTPLDIPARIRRRDVRTDDAARQPAAPLPHAPTPAAAPTDSPECPSPATDARLGLGLWTLLRVELGHRGLTFSAEEFFRRGFSTFPAACFAHEFHAATATSWLLSDAEDPEGRRKRPHRVPPVSAPADRRSPVGVSRACPAHINVGQLSIGSPGPSVSRESTQNVRLPRSQKRASGQRTPDPKVGTFLANSRALANITRCVDRFLTRAGLRLRLPVAACGDIEIEPFTDRAAYFA
jgi:hypothetical protein